MFLNMMNIGVRSTDTGNICVTRKPRSIALRPMNLYLAIAYEAGTARVTAIAIAPVDIMKKKQDYAAGKE